MTVIRQNFGKKGGSRFYAPRTEKGPHQTVKFPRGRGLGEAINSPVLTPAQNAYMSWLRGFYPHLYKIAEEKLQAEQTVDGLGFDIGSVFSSIAEGVGKLAPTILQLRQQRDMLKIQTQRAAQGQPPINTAQYMVTATPTPQAQQVVPDAPPPVNPTVTMRSGFSLSPTVLIGGAVALVGLLLFLRKR